MKELIDEARFIADLLDVERMPDVANLVRRLADALHAQSIELESRTALHVESLGLVKQLGDQVLDSSRQLAGVHLRRKSA